MMTGQPIPVALVLGSGGARGLAHIGVIRALQQSARYDIRSITGSSIGALIGGLHAGGKLETYSDWVRGLSRADVWGLLDFSFTSKGLFKGERLMNKLADLVGEIRIEELAIPFIAVASDIERRQEVWLNEGSLFEAIRASIAIPGLFTPVERGGHLLVDGGLLSPLPIAPTLGHKSRQTIAVSLNGSAARTPAQPESGDVGEGAPAAAPGTLAQWTDRARQALGLEATVASGDDAFDIMAKSLEAMQDRIARYQIAAYRPDLLIEIPVDACGVLDFHCAEAMIELGQRQADAALRRARDATREQPF
jgi:NTE family protein